MNLDKYLRTLAAAAGLAGMIAAPLAASALTINPNYINGAGIDWTDVDGLGTDGRNTFQAAIDVWESLIVDDINVTVDVTFSNIGSVGLWQGGFSAGQGDDINLRTGNLTINMITFDSSRINDFFFDQTPEDDGDIPFVAIDAMTTAMHELGHMMGFNSLFINDFQLPANQGDPLPPQQRPWVDLIVNDVFDPGGLNVAMAPGDSGHLMSTNGVGGSLLEPATFNGERRFPSAVELDMLALAHGYTVVPLPAALPLMVAALAGLGMTRRRQATSVV